jgi:hypothetical protein
MDDMDIDFDVDPEIARLNAEAEAINAVCAFVWLKVVPH